MDPFSAFGVAVNVIGLVDFTSKVVKRSFEVRSSIKGQPTQVSSLATCSAELSSATAAALRGIESLASCYPHRAESLKRLTAECSDVQAKVKAAIEKLTADRTRVMTRSTALVTIRSIWSDKELEELRIQLDTIRHQVQMNVVLCLLDETKKTEGRTEYILQAALRIEDAIGAMKTKYENFEGGRQVSDLEKLKIREAVWASTGLVDLPVVSAAAVPSTTSASLPVAIATAPNVAVAESKAFAQKICESLYVAEMDDRESRVKSAFPNTFQWLFDTNEDDPWEKKPELSFRRWLGSHEETIFWITGVPASGKSTLMKFITSHDSLPTRLHEWADGNPIYVAKFYFWNPGSKIQKSRVGLLRSLLYQLLSQRPDLAKAVAPRRRLFSSIAGDEVAPPQWEWAELRECMLRFASLMRETNSKLALFIDGLDEYEGFLEDNPKTHQTTDEMLDLFVDLNFKHGVKLCVSSRPLNYFRDKFHDNPSLTMQELTQPDIDHYIEVRLGESQAIKDLQCLEPENIAELESELKMKARGVFLWVVLVVEQLLITSADTPRIDAMRKILRDMPEDLNDLYGSIQKQIGPEKEYTASKLYQLTMAWKRNWSSQMEATFLWLADKDGSEQKEFPSAEMEAHIVELTRRLLEGHTRGILQISNTPSAGRPTVDFLHRTAYEWLQERHNWERILDKGPIEYQPILAIVAVLVSHAKTCRFSSWFYDRCVTQIFLLASEVPDTPDARSTLVHIIDKVDCRPLERTDYRGIFGITALQLKDRHINFNPVTLAATFACHNYLRGKLEVETSMVVESPGNKYWFLPIRHCPPQIPLLEVAIFGYFPADSPLLTIAEHEFYVQGRILDYWHASRRLETIKLLLERGARIESYMKKLLNSLNQKTALRSGNKDIIQGKYVRLILDIARQRKVLESFNSLRNNVLPTDLVQESYNDRLFPEYRIL